MSNIIKYFDQQGYETILVNDYMAPKGTGVASEYAIPLRTRRAWVGDNEKGRISRNILRIWQLRKIIKKERPDVALSFLGGPNVRLLLATLGINVKRVVSVRNDPKIEYGERFWKRICINWLFTSSSGCVFQTKDAGKYFWKRVREKSVVIPNPIEDRFLDVSPNAETHDIVAVGRLEKQKNYQGLIRAFSNVADQIPNDRLCIYGCGTMEDELRLLIRSLQLSDRVFLMGQVDDVLPILQNAKLFVLNSYYEGMPNSLMEALAVGTKCVATDCPVGGPRELIENGVNGLLVPVNGEVALQEAILKLMQHREETDSFSFGAKESMRKYHLECIGKRWEDFLING